MARRKVVGRSPAKVVSCPTIRAHAPSKSGLPVVRLYVTLTITPTIPFDLRGPELTTTLVKPRSHSSSRPTTGVRALRPTPRTRPWSRQRAQILPSARMRPFHAMHPGTGPPRTRSGVASLAGGSVAASHGGGPRARASAPAYPLGTRSASCVEREMHGKYREGNEWGKGAERKRERDRSEYLDEKAAVGE